MGFKRAMLHPKARIELDWGAREEAEDEIKPKESAHSYRR